MKPFCVCCKNKIVYYLGDAHIIDIKAMSRDIKKKRTKEGTEPLKQIEIKSLWVAFLPGFINITQFK